MYFRDLEKLNDFFAKECYQSPSQLRSFNNSLQCEVALHKYLYLDPSAGEIAGERGHKACTPFLLWLQSESLAGRLSVKLEELDPTLGKPNVEEVD